MATEVGRASAIRGQRVAEARAPYKLRRATDPPFTRATSGEVSALARVAGAPFYWLIDPELRVVEALALRDGVWADFGVFADTTTARIALFDAIELEI